MSSIRTAASGRYHGSQSTLPDLVYSASTKAEMTNSNGLKVFIFVPAKLGRLDRSTKYQQALKCCPACGGKLVLFHEKFGEINGEFRTRLGSTGSSNGRGSSGVEPRPWNPPGSKDSQSGVHGGWYCSTCGVHIMPELKPPVSHNRTAKNASRSMEDLKNAPKYAESTSSNSSFKGKVVDEHFEELAGHFHQSFLTLMSHVREHFLLKEAQLKEYQVDLCQRERMLRANEEYMDQRYDNLRSAEEVLTSKTERLHLYKESMLSHLEGRAQQLSRYETSLREWREQMIREMDPARQDPSRGSYIPAATNPEYMDHRTLIQQTRRSQNHMDDETRDKEVYKSRAYSAVSDQTEVRKSYRQSWHDPQTGKVGADSVQGLHNSRTEINNPQVTTKPPIPTQRFAPIFQYRTSSRAQLPGQGSVRHSSAERRSWDRAPLVNKDDNNNAMDSPASKPSADPDSGYTSTSVSMNRSDSPDRLNASVLPQSHSDHPHVTSYDLKQDGRRPSLGTMAPTSSNIPNSHKIHSSNVGSHTYPGTQNWNVDPGEVSRDRRDSQRQNFTTNDNPMRSKDGRRSNQSGVGVVDSENTKPLNVYTTASVKPDENIGNYSQRQLSAGPQYYSEQNRTGISGSRDEGQHQRPVSPRTYLAPPRSWLEGPRRVTEL